jgi:copper transporter 1
MDHGHDGHGGMDNGPTCSMQMLWYVRASTKHHPFPSLPVVSCRISTEPTYRPRIRRNTQIKDTCIVFKQWHISSHFVFALSFIAIIFISLGYEYLRAYQRSVDRRIALALSRGKGRDKGVVSGRSSPSELSGADIESAGLLSGRRKKLSSWYAYALTHLRV